MLISKLVSHYNNVNICGALALSANKDPKIDNLKAIDVILPSWQWISYYFHCYNCSAKTSTIYRDLSDGLSTEKST